MTRTKASQQNVAPRVSYFRIECEKIILIKTQNYFCPFLSSWIILVERGQVKRETTGKKYVECRYHVSSTEVTFRA